MMLPVSPGTIPRSMAAAASRGTASFAIVHVSAEPTPTTSQPRSGRSEVRMRR